MITDNKQVSLLLLWYMGMKRSLISLNCCQTESCVSNLVGMGFMSDWRMTETDLGYWRDCVSVCTTSKYGVQWLWARLWVMWLWPSEHLCRDMCYLWVMDDGMLYAGLMFYAVLGCSTRRLLRERTSTVHSEEPYRTKYSPLWGSMKNNVQSRLRSIMCDFEKLPDVPLKQVKSVQKRVQTSTSVYQSTVKAVSDVESQKSMTRAYVVWWLSEYIWYDQF